MIIDEFSLKNIMIATFKRKKGLSKKTMPFDELSNLIKEKILSSTTLEQRELPVLVSLTGINKWLLLTTDRIIQYQDHSISFINNNNIEKIKLDLNAELKVKNSKSNEFNYLKIISKQGDNYLIQVEPGFSHTAIWSVLSFLRDRNS